MQYMTEASISRYMYICASCSVVQPQQVSPAVWLCMAAEREGEKIHKERGGLRGDQRLQFRHRKRHKSFSL